MFCTSILIWNSPYFNFFCHSIWNARISSARTLIRQIFLVLLVYCSFSKVVLQYQYQGFSIVLHGRSWRLGYHFNFPPSVDQLTTNISTFHWVFILVHILPISSVIYPSYNNFLYEDPCRYLENMSSKVLFIMGRVRRTSKIWSSKCCQTPAPTIHFAFSMLMFKLEQD